MHTRRFAVLLLGLWFGLSIAMIFVATQNFRGVDRLLEAPAAPASKMLAPLGKASSRMLLRYQAAELNRFFFETYGTVQMALAVLLMGTMLFATNGHKTTLAICGLIAAAVVFENWWLTPEIVYLGKAIDFVPQEMPSAERARFWSFHSAFSGTEVVKLLLLGILAAKMLVKGNHRRRLRGEDPDEETQLPGPA